MAKARTPKLKVFRTAIGFHDAYIAAPSQKAALEAWGAGSNLFAQGLAEPVSDEELMAEPLAQPGKVVKRARGSAREYIAALGDHTKQRSRPDRAKLEAAEKALAKLDEEQRAEREALEQEMDRLRKRRSDMAKRHETALRKATDRVDRAREAANKN